MISLKKMFGALTLLAVLSPWVSDAGRCGCTCENYVCECICGNLEVQILEPKAKAQPMEYTILSENNKQHEQATKMDQMKLHGFTENSNSELKDFSAVAICQMILGELYVLNKLQNSQFHDKARELFARKIETDGDREEAKFLIKQCEFYVTQEMKRLYIPSILINNCPLETIPYNLFLCQLSWPEDIMALLPWNFCKSSCHEIQTWNSYHLNRGRTVFPDGWEAQVNNQLDNDEDKTCQKDKTCLKNKNIGTGNFQGSGTDDMYTRSKRYDASIHGVAPHRPPRRFVKEFFETNINSIGNWSRQAKCADDEWPFAIEDALPFGIRIHCTGPNGYAGSHVVGDMDVGAVAPTLFNCTTQVEFAPPNGSLLIGMSNRVSYSPLTIIVAGVFLCSGEENWTTVKRDSEFDTINGTGEVVRCETGTIICTIELKMRKYDGKDFTTDVRVGCCEATLEYMYSSMTLIPMRTVDKDGVWSDVVASSLSNRSSLLQDKSWQKDYFTPFGNFLDKFSSRYTVSFQLGDGLDAILDFGYNNFRKDSSGEWPDQDPVPIPTEPGSTVTKICQKGFFNAVQVYTYLETPGVYWGFAMKCSETSGWVHALQVSTPPADQRYFFLECPPMTLICGLRKFVDYDGNLHSIAWSNYMHTYICCPVYHTGSSICGEEQGVVLTAEPAKVDCIAVSGTDTKCTTTQMYGTTSGVEMSEGNSTDKSTEQAYGFTKADRWQRVVSGESTTKVSGSAEFNIPLVGSTKVEVSTEIKVGGSTTTNMDTESTNSNATKDTIASNFNKAMSTESSNSTLTTTEYDIKDGQRAIFYDVVKRCGGSTITSEDFIRILTPSLKCTATETYEYIFGWSTTLHGYEDELQITFTGFGLEIEDDTFISPLERGVNWEIISMGVREKFTESVTLADTNHLEQGGYDFRRSPRGLWDRATYGIQYNYTFPLNIFGTNYRFYRLVGVCGRWRALTSSIWYQHGDEANFTHLKDAADPLVILERGYNFTVLP